MDSLRAVIEKQGLAHIASACEVSPQAVHKWLKSGVPAARVLDVERVTGISRHQLRPDIFGEAPAASAERAA